MRKRKNRGDTKDAFDQNASTSGTADPVNLSYVERCRAQGVGMALNH